MGKFIFVAACIVPLSITKMAAVPDCLLDKPYNQVLFLMTHNSTSLRHESTELGDAMRKIASVLPNSFPFSGLRDKVYNIIKTINLQDPNIVADQERDLNAQLSDGVRGFKLPIQLADTSKPGQSDILVCHMLTESQFASLVKEAQDKLSFIPIKKIRDAILKPLYDLQKNPCQFDKSQMRLIDVFSTLSQWLDKHSQEVVGIYLDVSFSDKQSATATMQSLLQRTGLGNKLYWYTSGAWPTLRRMIETNKRVVIMASCSNWKNIGISYTNEIEFGSDYAYNDPAAVFNDTNNPKITHGTVGINQLFVLDNYTTPLISGRVVHAQQVNQYGRIKQRIANYEQFARQPVTFVMVDFYNEPNSDAIKAVNDINQARCR
jgi:hypothetical protein